MGRCSFVGSFAKTSLEGTHFWKCAYGGAGLFLGGDFGQEVGLELVALAFEFKGAGLQFVGDDLSVAGVGAEGDGGRGGAGEVIVLKSEGGGLARGLDGGTAEVHEGAGGDAAVVDVGQDNGGALVVLEQAAIDVEAGGLVFFGAAFDDDQGMA